MPESRLNTPYRGSYFLAQYELRITRCSWKRIKAPPDTPIGALLNHPIVKALVKDRATDPDAGKTIGPEAGEETIRRLGYGHDHRGATRWDSTEKVVWLCAYHGKHRSGAAEDPFKKHFPELIAAKRMKPTAADYETLFADRTNDSSTSYRATRGRFSPKRAESPGSRGVRWSAARRASAASSRWSRRSTKPMWRSSLKRSPTSVS